MPRRHLPDTAHRPWPLPPLPWIMFQSWQQLLFIHWRIPAEDLRPLVPRELDLDEYDGSAWVAATPFRLVGLRPRVMPAIPGLSDFLEMNLRTYVRRGGKSGIYFFTLEASSRLAVSAARAIYRLPYHHARMAIQEDGEWTHYTSERKEASGPALECRWRQSPAAFEPRPGTLEHFLTERYALFTVLRRGRVLRGEIHHAPWELQQAELEIDRNTLLDAYGIRPPEQSPIAHYSARQDTYVWAPVAD